MPHPGEAPDSVSLSFQSLLEAMEGITYVVNRGRLIVACGETNWRRFAQANAGEPIMDPAKVIGRPIMTFIEGKKVADAYGGYLDRLFAGSLPRVSFKFRCDAPDLRRDLWMSISPIGYGGDIAAVLFQSVTLKERDRPPIGLFDFAHVDARFADSKKLPIVNICSYCQSVALGDAPDEDKAWITPEAYYRSGGPSEVRLSHGICPTCLEQYVRPFLDEPPTD